tara:strand:- start:130 stop:291 length:162 start_codon:yes stop_codon:yes gene_type:complete
MTNELTEQVLIAVGGIILGFIVGLKVPPDKFFCKKSSSESLENDTEIDLENNV